MGIPQLESEFMGYWQKLTPVEKESLLTVARNYVHLKEDTDDINVEEYNREIEAAMTEVKAGEFYTHEQVVEMSKGWVNRK